MSKEKLKKYGTTFHFASQFLGKSHMEATTALYSICREIDDIADINENSELARNELLHLKESLERGTPDHPIAVQAFAIAPSLSIDVLVELIDGAILDTYAVGIRTELELLQYCYQVAGTVGLLMCDLFEVQDPIARHHAIDLGVAMQLTNICRDVKEDAKNNRRYLPLELIGDLSPIEILSASEEAKLSIKKAVSHLLHEADIRYKSGISGLCFLPPQPRIAILMAALIYREIGVLIEDRNFNIWLGRVHTSTKRKLMVACRGVLVFMFSRKVHRYQGYHDSSLHRGLSLRPGVHWAS